MRKIYLESFNENNIISYGPTMIKTNKKEILQNYKLSEKVPFNSWTNDT